LPDSIDFKRGCLDPDHPQLSVRRQCELLGLNRSSWYYQRLGVSAENLALMRQIDEQYLKTPWYGRRRMGKALGIDDDRAGRLMRRMGLEAIYPKPRLSRGAPGHRIYPYLLRNVKIVRPDQVWSSDITYVPMPQGWMYLTVVMDWYSRSVLSWRLSNTLDGLFCLEALEEALGDGTPEIFNTDQGVQYTAEAFTGRLEAAGVRVSMDGRGRWMDNVFVERLWRSVKYGEVYLRAYDSVAEARQGLDRYFRFYNARRTHQALDRRTPDEVYFQSEGLREAA
jgi:putative transposase